MLERASVAGRNFTGSLVAALLSEGERRTLGEHLMTLVRRQLIQPNPSALSVGDVQIHARADPGGGGRAPKKCAPTCTSAWPGGLDRNRRARTRSSFPSRAVVPLPRRAWPGRRARATARRRGNCAPRGGRHKAFALGDPEACGNLLGRAASLLPPDDPTRLALLPTLGAAPSKPVSWRKLTVSSPRQSSDRRVTSSSTRGHASRSSSSAYRRTPARSTTCNAWRMPAWTSSRNMQTTLVRFGPGH